MCYLYTMTATVNELHRVSGSFDGYLDNLPPSDASIPASLLRCCAVAAPAD